MLPDRGQPVSPRPPGPPVHPRGEERPLSPRRARLHEIIFESNTPAGRAFDVWLLIAIALSVGAVMLESVGAVRARFGSELYAVEWFFTILFTVEYALRSPCPPASSPPS